MDIVLFILGWLIGLVVASFTLVQAGIVLFFGIPMTRKLNKEGKLISPNPIQRRNSISLIIWFVVYFGVLYLVQLWSQNVFVGYLVGTGIILLLSIGKLGTSKNNLTDYLETNKRFLKTRAEWDKPQE